MAFCGNCGTSVSGSFCTNCGSPSSGSVQVTTKPLPPPMPFARSEETLFDEAGIFISSSRFVAGGQTYAMSGVTSVGTEVKQPSRKGPLLMILFGVLFLIMGLNTLAQGGSVAVVVGMGLIILGGLIFVKRVPLYTVLLRSASGEQRATSSPNKEFILRVISTLNDAIVMRG